MSTGAAIAATTQLIRMALQDFLPDLSGALGGRPDISALPPDRISTGASEPVQLNVFFYRADPNPALRNLDLPTRRADGSRLTQPPLAINLHYLVSAYAKADLQAEILLGYAMEILHGLNGLTSALVSQQLTGSPPPDVPPALWQIIAACGLDQQAEQLTISLEPQSIDDISKLWSVLGEKYRPSAAYRVTVVLIQPEGPTAAALPVTQIPEPVVALRLRPAVRVAVPAEVSFAAGAPVGFVGSNLIGPGTTVLLGDTAMTPEGNSTADRLVVLLTAAQRSGVLRARVRHSLDVGGTERDFEFSNSIAVTVRPVPGVTAVIDAGGGLPRRLQVAVRPAVAVGQVVGLRLNRPGGGESSSIDALPATAPGPSGTVEFPIDGVVAGTYLLRLRVDEAESALTTDDEGTFTGPTVVIP
jgi:Pvc16 N-terminal domain